MAFNKNFTEEILDSLGEAVFTVDKSFKVNFFNKAAEKITGFKRSEVLGKFCKHVLKSDLCHTDCPIALVLNSNKNIYDFESKIRSDSGTVMPIKLNAAVLYNENSEPVGGVISFRDISELEAIKKNLEKRTQYHGIIGHSKPMLEIYDLVEELNESDAPVFIRGESGTGKELIANAIQETSNRKNEPFVKINCSVFPSHLLASELFGHVKGAFTDAVKDRPGRFEIADKGTLFLDEVAEMPLQMQLQLLRVLQEGTFERVGESITRYADVRVIAATNINIHDALAHGKFREDLYYRLNVIPIEIPPLRNRLEDIVPLIDHFLNKFSLLYKKSIKDVEDDVLDLLVRYSWPGNIRELENVLEYAYVRTSSENIPSSKLPAMIKEKVNNGKKYPAHPLNSSAANQNEETQLLNLLEKYHWNRSRVAEELKIGRTTLWRKLKKHGLITE